MTDRQLLYFADPMCSWCWGFSPVIHQVAENWADTAPVDIHVGGLRAGNTRPMNQQQRMYILNHWFHVNEASDQPFDFSFKMPDDFVYDTEPACRAIKVMQELDPAQALAYFSAIQHAFYAQNQDVTRPETLASLAEGLGVDKTEFKTLFESDAARQAAQNDFMLTQQFGVNGFPCLIGRTGEDYVFIAQGYQGFDRVKSTIQKWLG